MVWILYMPESEDTIQSVETWVPFQAKLDFADQGREGKIRTGCLLRCVDARSTSARKLMVRAGLSLSCEAVIPSGIQIAVPVEVPPDIHTLKNKYPLRFAVDAGEKLFTVDEDLTLPASCPEIARLIRYDIHPELIDQKVVSNKAVFRGVLLVHLLYSSENGELHCWDFEVPFSQYTELDGEYSEEASASFWFAVTNLEVEITERGSIHLLAGMTGQYTITDSFCLDVLEDAYGIKRSAKILMQSVQVPAVLDTQQKIVGFSASPEIPCSRIADICWYPDQVALKRRSDETEAELSGVVQVLYYDSEGKIQNYTQNVEEKCIYAADSNIRAFATVCPSGKPSAAMTQLGPELHMDILMNMCFDSETEIKMAEGIEVGEYKEKRIQLPSLILKRAGDESLWSLAKKSGSTMEAIMEANQLSGDPDKGKLLLIPVIR